MKDQVKRYQAQNDSLKARQVTMDNKRARDDAGARNDGMKQRKGGAGKGSEGKNGNGKHR